MLEFRGRKCIIRVGRRNYKGHDYLDIREWSGAKREPKPTRKGVTISSADWSDFVEWMARNMDNIREMLQ